MIGLTNTCYILLLWEVLPFNENYYLSRIKKKITFNSMIINKLYFYVQNQYITCRSNHFTSNLVPRAPRHQKGKMPWERSFHITSINITIKQPRTHTSCLDLRYHGDNNFTDQFVNQVMIIAIHFKS